MTSFQKHVANWKNCQLCELSKYRKQVVIARGTIPAEVLFIGEAPGASEDSLGVPFIGPAGKLLDEIIDRAKSTVLSEFSICFSNLVGCIPLGDDLKKTAEPPKEAVKQCFPRVKELVWLVQPRLIVLVGQLARKNIYWEAQFVNGKRFSQEERLPWLNGEPLQFAEITHPSAILRAPLVGQGLMVQKAIITLIDAFELLRGIA